MNEKQMRPLLEVWLRDRQIPPPRAQAGVAKVMANVPRTRQQGRWPLPVLRRKVQPPTATDTTEYQPSPIPATNGHTPTVIGRTQSMFSPVKAITAGVIVAALGGMMLIAQPFGQQGSVPGAATEGVEATWVTGTIDMATCSDPDTEADGDVTRRWNYVCGPQVWTASDPRFTGEAASIWNDDEYRMDDGLVKVVNLSALFMRNEGGGWTCSSPNLLGGGGLFPAGLTGGGATYTCVGDDGYAGLSAVLILDGAKGYSEEFSGLVFPGDIPPLPEAPAVE